MNRSPDFYWMFQPLPLGELNRLMYWSAWAYKHKNQITDWKENNPVFAHVADQIFYWRVCCVLKKGQGIQFCVYQINQNLKSVAAWLPGMHLSQQSFEINWNVSFPPANWHDRLVIIKHYLLQCHSRFSVMSDWISFKYHHGIAAELKPNEKTL